MERELNEGKKKLSTFAPSNKKKSSLKLMKLKISDSSLD